MTKGAKTTSYYPGLPPGNSPGELWMYEEMRKVASWLNQPVASSVQLAVLHAAPLKPTDGLVVYADGTDWEPDGASGEGFYGYYNSTWNYLG